MFQFSHFSSVYQKLSNMNCKYGTKKSRRIKLLLHQNDKEPKHSDELPGKHFRESAVILYAKEKTRGKCTLSRWKEDFHNKRGQGGIWL